MNSGRSPQSEITPPRGLWARRPARSLPPVNRVSALHRETRVALQNVNGPGKKEATPAERTGHGWRGARASGRRANLGEVRRPGAPGPSSEPRGLSTEGHRHGMLLRAGCRSRPQSGLGRILTRERATRNRVIDY